MDELSVVLNNSNVNQHECVSVKSGDWVIFSCPQCPGYERRINLHTQEMRLQDPNQGKYTHVGRHSPRLLHSMN